MKKFDTLFNQSGIRRSKYIEELAMRRPVTSTELARDLNCDIVQMRKYISLLKTLGALTKHYNPYLRNAANRPQVEYRWNPDIPFSKLMADNLANIAKLAAEAVDDAVVVPIQPTTGSYPIVGKCDILVAYLFGRVTT